MTLHTQLLTMLSMIAGGVYLGFVTETFRRASNSWKNNVYLTYMFEISFWVIQTVFLFFILYKVNDGELRAYIFLACLLGVSIYVVLFQTTYKRILEFGIKVAKVIIKSIVQAIYVLIVQPIKWLIQAFVTIVLFLLHVCERIILFIWNVLFHLLRLLFNSIKPLLPKKFTKMITNLIEFCSTILDKLKNLVKKLFNKRR